MTDLQRSVLAIISALVVLLATLILRSSGNQAESVRVTEAELLFESSSACDTARSLATRFPERAMGTDDGKAAATWIESEMKRFGLRTARQQFSAWIAGERVEGQNIIGTDEGIRDGVIVMVAHYDIPFHVREGAMDDASGVGVLLELARVFSREEQNKTLVFIASDGEEWGMLGARHFVKEYPGLEQIRAVVSFDCVGLERSENIFLYREGQFCGHTPLWLWMLAEDCISRVGGKTPSPSLLMQYASQAVNISGTDQGPFLRAGVPGINFGSSPSKSPLARKVYHTRSDTSENLKPELFEMYGRATELLTRSVDALDHSTDNNPYYLRTGKRMYVGRFGLLTLQVFLFLPLFLATVFQYYNLRVRERFIRKALVEVANISLFALPWLFALGVLYLLVWTNFVPKYELYPATLLDPFLSNPDWSAIAIVASAFVAAWIGICFLRRSLSLWGKPDFASSKAVCLDVLFTLSLIALILNGFTASFFLAPAALLWGWIEQDPRVGHRLLNGAFALAGALPIVFFTIVLSQKVMLGPYVFWYLFLGVGYWFFSPLAVLIAVGTATVGGRLLQTSFAKIRVTTEPGAENE
ncbi:MAG: Zn-dependent exopeptidase M28 [Candidatus Hydrogenedentota bacterium]|nr:MAG: Zn-dependent exopeptidase M28 [Candidatus Hydrogenedentota bacterium]